MAKYYIYYNHETENDFCTVYEWALNEDTIRRYCGSVGEGRYTHKEIQLDTQARILTDKRSGEKYALVEPKKHRPNLQFESIHMETVEWEEAV